MNLRQEMLLQMARDNTRLALDQLTKQPFQMALALKHLQTAQMNLEHFVLAEGGKQIADHRPALQQPTTIEAEIIHDEKSERD